MIQYWSRSTTTSTQSLTWSHESYRWTWRDMPVTQIHGGWDVSIAMVSETDRGRKKKVKPQGLVIGWNQTCILNFYFQSWNEQTVKSEQCLSIEETKVVLFCFWSWNWIQSLTHGRQKLYTKLSNIPNLLFILYFIGVSFYNISHYSSGYPKTHYVAQVASNLWPSSCFIPPNLRW